MKNKRDFKFEDKEYTVVAPNARINQEAQRVYSAEFMKCLESGLKVRKKLKEVLKEHGVWTDAQEAKEKEITEKINVLEVELYQGEKGKDAMSLSEGRAKALEIKKLRNEHMELIAERQSYESNTAESIAENIRFDYLVSQCTLNKDGTKVYNSFEDYQSNSTEDLAYEAASNLAQMLYSLEDDYAKKLPENHFLSTFGLVDEQLRLVNKDKHLVDVDGRLINDKGYYLGPDGDRVDRDGRPLTEDGFFKLEAHYVDEDGNEVLPIEEPKTEDSTEVEEPIDEEGAEDKPKRGPKKK